MSVFIDFRLFKKSTIRSFVWEILQNTLNKVVTRVAQVKAKLEGCQQMHQENEAKRANEALTESNALFPI